MLLLIVLLILLLYIYINTTILTIAINIANIAITNIIMISTAFEK